MCSAKSKEYGTAIPADSRGAAPPGQQSRMMAMWCKDFQIFLLYWMATDAE
jgi:hypothetical protein